MSDATTATPTGDGSLILRAQTEGRWADVLAMGVTRSALGPRETQAVVAAAATLGDGEGVRRAAERAVAIDLPPPVRAGCALILARHGWAEESLAVLVADPAAPLHRASLPALMLLAGAAGLPLPLRSLARSLLRRTTAHRTAMESAAARGKAPGGAPAQTVAPSSTPAGSA